MKVVVSVRDTGCIGLRSMDAKPSICARTNWITPKMNTIEHDLYEELIFTLVKATGNSKPRGLARSLALLQQDGEASVLKVLLKILKLARVRFLRKFTVAKWVGTLAVLAKADSEKDIRDELRSMMQSAFDGADAALVAVLERHVADLAKNFSSVYNVKINYSLVNDGAVAALRAQAKNTFTQIAQEQADGIREHLADAMSVPLDTATFEGGFDIRTLIQAIRSNFGTNTMYYPKTDQKPAYTLDSTKWATQTARTEVAQAASTGTRASLESIGMRYWEWNAAGTACDECSQNNGEVREIGQEFPSGDEAPSAHPNCLCIVCAIQDELAAGADYSPPDTE